MEEAVGGAKAMRVDKVDHVIKFVQTILQRCARQDQCKSRLQKFEDTTRFGFPVLDPLPLIQNDQVPRDGSDGGFVAHDLFVVGNFEERVREVLIDPLGGGSQNDLASASTKAMDFTPPLALERRRADHQDILNAVNWASSSAVPIPWMVLPSPISSARIARPAPTAKAIPSS